MLNTSNDETILPNSVSNDASESNNSIESVRITPSSSSNGHIEQNLVMQQPPLITTHSTKDVTNDEKDIMLEWHRNKPSIWQQYYGSKRLKYSNMVKKIKGKFDVNATVMTYVSIEHSEYSQILYHVHICIIQYCTSFTSSNYIMNLYTKKCYCWWAYKC